MIGEYEVLFDVDNYNSLLFYKDNKLVKILALPPTSNGCDIININDDVINKGYTYNFDGIIIITNCYSRELYYKGELLDSINKNNKL